MRAVAAGADVNAPMAGPEASQLAAAVEVRLSEAGCASPSGRGSVQPNVTPLLLACQASLPMLDLTWLCQQHCMSCSVLEQLILHVEMLAHCQQGLHRVVVIVNE